jgi:hypothetical protein
VFSLFALLLILLTRGTLGYKPEQAESWNQ